MSILGRRKYNPALVQELIDGYWTMPQDEFEAKYFPLSSSDMSYVSGFIEDMEKRMESDDYFEDYVDSIWGSDEDEDNDDEDLD